MTGLRVTTQTALLGAVLAALAGCATPIGLGTDVGLPTDDPTTAPGPAAEPDDAEPDDLEPDPGTGAAGGISQTCLDLFPQSAAGVGTLDLEPAGWPDPPADSTLCYSAETLDGLSETASYVSSAAPEEVFAHYEAALGTQYDVVHSDGQENGTGFETLDGSGAGIGFQIRASEGGFTIVFVTDGV